MPGAAARSSRAAELLSVVVSVVVAAAASEQGLVQLGCFIVVACEGNVLLRN